ncbi:hypothetical protein [Desulfurispora thermophila]|uniref:hypothetical protein n=1 Tax=Desulfurispora thermophila TaxID=265470 RepID=UPI000367AA4F|nr:hypothetical protein [Desulfurispora thermophila]
MSALAPVKVIEGQSACIGLNVYSGEVEFIWPHRRLVDRVHRGAAGALRAVEKGLTSHSALENRLAMGLCVFTFIYMLAHVLIAIW